jgi:phage tail protein X
MNLGFRTAKMTDASQSTRPGMAAVQPPHRAHRDAAGLDLPDQAASMALRYAFHQEPDHP